MQQRNNYINKLFNIIRKEGVLEAGKKTFNFIKRHVIIDYDCLKYECEYQDNIDFSEYKTDVKAIAFYLPQFHSIPENDEWWGKGFTEWTNTQKAKPMFKEHYQPREPHDDIGYYDLTEINSIKKQAEIARQHGIYGFCFYYYWFSGKRLLEKPLDLLLEHPEIDINFCLCWANSNWTRKWDGSENEILIKQDYAEDDPEKFINDLKRYIDDPRYIKIDGKPVILVYDPGQIPDIKELFIKWKEYSVKIGIGDILIWICNTFWNTIDSLDIHGQADAVVEFMPHSTATEAKYFPKLSKNGYVFDYKELYKEMKQKIINKKVLDNYATYRSCMTGWDNSARNKIGYYIYAGFSLKCFYNWIKIIANEAKLYKEPLFFFNAWNEWAEGTYLEPDRKYGYAVINTFSKALYDLSFKTEN